MGRSLESRASEKKGCCGGGGRFKIDLPGIGMVTADDDADGESIAASQTKERVVREVEGDGRVSCDCSDPRRQLVSLMQTSAVTSNVIES